jgi:hypothetical protein
MAFARAIGVITTSRNGITPTAGTAGTSFSGTAITGTAIDRLALNNPLSLVVNVNVASNLTATKTMTVHTVIQHAPDGTTWTTYTQPNGVAPIDLVQSATGANVGIQTTNVDLSGAHEFVRIQVTPTLSASGTDTGVVAATLIFGGEAEQPTA